MKHFKRIIITLKNILNLQSSKKVLDKDIAIVLNMKPTTLASYKYRDKLPYKSILTYCYENNLDVKKILFDELELILDSPNTVENNKIKVRYFKTLDEYRLYIEKYPSQISS